MAKPFNPKKLAALSRDQKLKLLDLIKEKRRREAFQLDRYVPNDGQLQVHKCDKKIRLVISGNGSGKSTLAVNEAVWACDGYNPILKQHLKVPRKVVVLLDKPDKVADKWLPEIRKWFKVENKDLHKHGKPYITEITRPNGSSIRFFFHDQDELTFESMELDDLICDEPPPRRVYVSLLRGMRNRDSAARVLIIGTPLTGSWLRKDIYEPWAKGDLKDTECFRYSTEVNSKNLPEGYIDWFSSKLSEKERRIRIEGHFFDLDGLALAHLYKPEKHLVTLEETDWRQEYPVVISIDPHPSKKHVAGMLGATKDGLIWIKELALKCTPRDFAKELKKWYKGFRVIDIVCDNLGSSEMTGGEGFMSFIEVLRQEGIQVRPTTYHEKVDADWISRIQDVLKIPEVEDNFGQTLPKLRINRGCNGLINDIESVEWQKYKNIDEAKPSLAIQNKDYLACLKYALATNINIYKKPNTVYYSNHKIYGFEPKSKRLVKTGLFDRNNRIKKSGTAW